MTKTEKIISSLIALAMVMSTLVLTLQKHSADEDIALALPVYIVPQGGTGASSFNKYLLAGAGGTGAITATSSPWMVSLTATSTTDKSGFGTSSPWGFHSINPNGQGVGVPEFVIGSSTATHFVVTGSGNVGINNSTPISTLDVTGNITIGGGANQLQFTPIHGGSVFGRMYISSSAPRIDNLGGVGTGIQLSGNGTSIDLYVQHAGNVGIASTTPWGLLSVNPNVLTSGSPEFVIGSSTATHLIVDANGNLGLGGTTSPGTLLSIKTTGVGATGINITSATSTFGSTGGIDLRNGCFAINGTCLSSGSGSATTFSYSTTSSVQMGTTTADFSAIIPAGITHLDVFFHASSTPSNGINAIPSFFVNTYSGATEYTYSTVITSQDHTGTTNSTGDDVAQLVTSGNNGKEWTIHLQLTNTNGEWKYGDFSTTQNASIGGANDDVFVGTFSRKNTAAITSVSFTTSANTTFATSTIIQVHGW